jgi:dethiobiotin synthase
VFRGLFVTGTDTGVGKTVVSAALMRRFRSDMPLRYWKPIQTGIERDDDTAEVGRLGDCADHLLRSGVRLPRPVSPHLAARAMNIAISVPSLLATLQQEAPSTRWIVEGAGGVLVPINQTETMADFMQLLGLPLLVVARTSLGTINHTLLTIEALRRRSLDVAGVAMVGDPHPDNRDAIERYGQVSVIGELPCLRPLTPDRLDLWARRHLDPSGELLRVLR